MDLSYTQNLEDYHLSLAFAGQVTGRYIDVGAGHPVADNVSCWFYQRGWRGIVVEPQPELAALYARLRPRDTVVQALVGRTNGERDFFLVERLHGFSTTIERHAQNAQALGVGYRSLRLPVVTLASLCEAQGVGEIDFLKIDVEGAEPDVLAGGDFKRFRPKVIVAEAVAPGSGEPAGRIGSRNCCRKATASRCSTLSIAFTLPRSIPPSWPACRASAPTGTRCVICMKLAARPTTRSTRITRWRAISLAAFGPICPGSSPRSSSRCWHARDA